MKVFIGPYKNWFGPFQIADLLQYFGVNEARCHEIGKYLSETWVNDVCQWFDSKKKRKVKVHIDNYDVWSMDSTLGYIIHPMLVMLRDRKHGSPNVDDADVPENIRSTAAPAKENEWDTDEFHHQRWEYVLDEMIFAFSQINEDWEDQYYSDYGKMHFEEVENGYSQMVWDRPSVYDREGMKKHQDRMTNGFRLFGRYYQALWD
jgi:hypothetical protein